MSIVGTREITLAVVASVALAGCGSVGRFDPSPAHTVDLSGSWTLDRTLSDDPKPIIEKLRPQPAKHGWDRPPDDELEDDTGPPEGGGRQGGGGGGGRGGGGSRRGGSQSQGQPQVAYRNNNDAYTHSTVMKMLLADLARAESLTIRQDPDRFTLDYGGAVRNFTPGAVSVVSASWGVADQSSGWKGREYVIHVKPQMGVASVESFSLTDDGKHLVEELHLGGGEFPGVKLKRVYDRADHPVPRDVPTND
ncbi:MAG TPA: hypothetical protein VGO18_03495 [Steroidobacteraceae bacterium]|nr:hypothetical protein [Steroidobacteraceae bacterium]